MTPPKQYEFHHFAQRCKSYSITPEQLFILWDGQKGCCDICRIPLTLKGPSDNTANIDHNHDTGEVRGLLCTGCNRGLGFMDDSPAILRKAAAYLETNGYYGLLPSQSG